MIKNEKELEKELALEQDVILEELEEIKEIIKEEEFPVKKENLFSRIKNRVVAKVTSMRLKDDYQLYLLAAPLVIWLLLFAYKPLWGVVMAFQNYSPFKGIAGSDFIGLDNFRNLMSGNASRYFWRAFRNTLSLSSYGLLIGFPIPIFIAIMFHELKGAMTRKLIQTVTYIPHFISEVVVSSLVLSFLALNTGIINILVQNVLGFFGFDYQHIQFMSNSGYFRGIYTLSGIWKEAGFASIVYFSALCGISMELYEAAKIDGANKLQQIWHISISGIRPTIVVMFIIRIGNILNIGYEKVLLLYNPLIYDKADILSTYTYRLGIENPDYGLSTAASLINSVIGFILVIAANRLSKKFTESGIW